MPSTRLLPNPETAPKSIPEIRCDILVAGGGMGACAAALQASRTGRSVIMVEPNEWIGGQMTSQGVSALDEHGYIESFGGTATYYELRERIRNFYRTHYTLSETQATPHLNPGNGWVSRICFEPKVGVQVLEGMLAPATQAGLLQIWCDTELVASEREANRIVSVTVWSEADGWRRILPTYVIDATELGDVLALAEIPYSTGMESYAQTLEPSAPADGNPEAVQSFTYTFAFEVRPGENHVIPKPADYERLRDTQPFSLNGYKMFEVAPGTYGAFWTYRRLIDAGNFRDGFPNDIAMINWGSNDYAGGNIIDVPPDQRRTVLDEAKRLSLSFLYWLQTEVPRDDGGGVGYPELMLRPDIMGTPDGLSQFPYIRESRRLKAFHTIREQDLVVAYNGSSRARLHPDSTGIGLYYYIDVHHCCNTELRPGAGQPVRPFQIPLGAMIGPIVTNYIAGCKNLGTTHITNGAYRLHPVEWNVGESAGILAAFALSKGVAPEQVYRHKSLLRELQGALVKAGIPLYWFVDVPVHHKAFAAVQTLAVQGVIEGDPAGLNFGPDEALDPGVAQSWMRKTQISLPVEEGESRGEYAMRLYHAILERAAAA